MPISIVQPFPPFAPGDLVPDSPYTPLLLMLNVAEELSPRKATRKLPTKAATLNKPQGKP